MVKCNSNKEWRCSWLMRAVAGYFLTVVSYGDLYERMFLTLDDPVFLY
jgi:hypothetical protein